MSTRTAPHNLEAEESLLGAMLLSRDAIAAATETVRAEHFYRPGHGHVFDAIATLYAAGEPADPITVADQLDRAGLLDAIGGPAVLVAMQASAPAISNAAKYAEIVEELAVLRSLINMAGEIAELGYSLPDDVEKAIDQAQAMVFRLAEHRTTSTMSSVHELLGETLDRLEELYERDGGPVVGVPTGYGQLDGMLSGLQPGALIVVGARPAMGKTSFALGMAAHAAVVAQRPALIFSLEMSRQEIMQRLLSMEARVDSQRMRTGKLSEGDWQKLSRATGTLSGAPIWIDDNPNTTVMEIRSKARKLKAQLGDLGLLVIDYLQLMTGGRGESRQLEVAEMSRGLKILARELEVPVVALAQLNRGLESRGEKRPMLSDLKESGSLEQDSDVVLLLYRDEVYNKDTQDQGIAEVAIAKHRGGPTGVARLAFMGQSTKFANMPRDGDNAAP